MGVRNWSRDVSFYKLYLVNFLQKKRPPTRIRNPHSSEVSNWGFKLSIKLVSNWNQTGIKLCTYPGLALIESNILLLRDFQDKPPKLAQSKAWSRKALKWHTCFAFQCFFLWIFTFGVPAWGGTYHRLQPAPRTNLPSCGLGPLEGSQGGFSADL